MKVPLAEVRKVLKALTPERVSAIRASLASGMELTEALGDYLDAHDESLALHLEAAAGHASHQAATEAERREHGILVRVRELARPQVAAYRKAMLAQADAGLASGKDLG